jgi:hypothetical protein
VFVHFSLTSQASRKNIANRFLPIRNGKMTMTPLILNLFAGTSLRKSTVSASAFARRKRSKRRRSVHASARNAPRDTSTNSSRRPRRRRVRATDIGRAASTDPRCARLLPPGRGPASPPSRPLRKSSPPSFPPLRSRPPRRIHCQPDTR